MRVAVLSDIHGFHPAFKTVLAEIDRSGPYDEIVIAGDIFEAGPGPDIVLDLLLERGYPAILGNTDLEILEASHQGAPDDEIAFALDQIGPKGVAFIGKLPRSYRISPPGGNGPDDDLLVVHANPRNLYDRLDPEYSDDQLNEVIGGERAAAIAFGHYHVSYQRRVDGRLLIDVSAVGNPKDGQLCCKFGVLTWDGTNHRWNGEIVRLPYPLAETEAAMRESGMPNWEKAFKKLKRATYKQR